MGDTALSPRFDLCDCAGYFPLTCPSPHFTALLYALGRLTCKDCLTGLPSLLVSSGFSQRGALVGEQRERAHMSFPCSLLVGLLQAVCVSLPMTHVASATWPSLPTAILSSSTYSPVFLPQAVQKG